MRSELIIPGVVFVLTLAFGFGLSRLGRPYNGLLFNVHKLLALAGVIVTVLQLIGLLKNAAPLALTGLGLLALTALAVIALFVSGALLSAGKLAHARLRTLHQIAPAALVIPLLAAISMLAEKP